MLGANRKFKVIHVITGLGVGGAERTLFNICRKLKGYEHIVVSLTGEGYYSGLLLKEGISVHHLNLKRVFGIYSSLIYFNNLIRIEKPDIIQTWLYHGDFFGGILGKLNRIGCIVWNIRHENLNPRYNKFTTLIIVKILSKLSYYIPSKIVTCSHAGMKSHLQYGYSDNFEIIPNGIDIHLRNVREPMLVLPKLQLNGLFIIGMAARYDVLKGYDYFLEALSIFKIKCPNFLCLMAGDNICSSNKDLVFKIQHWGLVNNIQLLGRTEDMLGFYNSIDVLVSSSLGEGFPNVIAEAMACGVPCVATDVGDSKVIMNNYGWVVPSSNSGELHCAISSSYDMFQQNKESWMRLKCLVKRQIELNFSSELMIGKYNDMWLKLVDI